ncbi:hypothetical protein MtrunA17_Chr4g0044591 [Medicago truncatula]|uniref:Transmembrane protein n=1 Tax=Medicago truncatula TaxID=3880 RepID=A0A396IEN0_MEDTR|nr:hypothetical protein MtrunA17_Chr4g0044591 [Medicago truncatula]
MMKILERQLFLCIFCTVVVSDSCRSILPCRAFIIVTSNLLWSSLVYSSPRVLHLVINVEC